MINLYIIDDDHLIGSGFEQEFGFESGFIHIAGYAYDLQQACSEIPKLNVNLIVLDLYIKFLNPVENIRLLRKLYPHIPVVILTHEQDLEWKIRMFEEGISAYIVKSPDTEALTRTFIQVAEGNRIIPEEVSHFMTSSKTDNLKSILDQKEKEIIDKLIHGLTITQIAESIFKTPSAVEKILHGTKEKFRVRTNYELIALLARVNLI
ncbi:MAG: response regulator transcription factor [Bacteroidetes bacterium]|nr:response regulator transcription factor [Bacteroidota bacterium]